MSNLPLHGLKVLDLSRLLPGPFCSLLLADLGAEVVKVEDPNGGDYIRWMPPYCESEEPTTRSTLFLALNRGKKSITLDLKSDEGSAAFLKLVAEYDVVLESFRPGVMDRLGVGYEQLKAVNPSIVYCAITGYGQDGPLKDQAGHDLNFTGRSGILALTGSKDGPPVQLAPQVGDVAGGSLMAAIGILAALRRKDRDGEGSFIDISMADGALAMLALETPRYLIGDEHPKRGELPLGGALACYRSYECKDGHVTFGAIEGKFWKVFCNGVEREDLLERQGDSTTEGLHAELEAIFKQRTRQEWEDFNLKHDCCIEPVLELHEALESELYKARNMLLTVQQPGNGPVKQVATPIRFVDEEPATGRPAPKLGQHNEEILPAT